MVNTDNDVLYAPYFFPLSQTSVGSSPAVIVFLSLICLIRLKTLGDFICLLLVIAIMSFGLFKECLLV